MVCLFVNVVLCLGTGMVMVSDLLILGWCYSFFVGLVMLWMVSNWVCKIMGMFFEMISDVNEALMFILIWWVWSAYLVIFCIGFKVSYFFFNFFYGFLMSMFSYGQYVSVFLIFGWFMVGGYGWFLSFCSYWFLFLMANFFGYIWLLVIFLFIGLEALLF